MSKNYCANNGLLIGASTPIPEDPSDFAFDRRWDSLPCSHVACSKCNNKVRWLDGVVAKGPPQQLYEADDPYSLPFVKSSSTFKHHRVYYCKCRYFGTIGAMPLNFHIEPMRSPPKSWTCGGHPPLTLPLTLGTVDVPAQPNWNLFIDSVLLGQQDTSKSKRIDDICYLFGRLRGTPSGEEIAEKMREWAQSDEPQKLGASIVFYWRFPQAPGSETLIKTAKECLETLVNIPSPYSNRGESLYSLLISVIGVLVRDGKPYEEPIRSWIRALGRRKGGLQRSIFLLIDYDLDWTINNFEALAVATPEFAAQALRHLTLKAKKLGWDPIPMGQFVKALPGIDQSAFERYQRACN